MRAAFGLAGQKCSANSRVYVERPVYDEFLELLAGKTEADHCGDPLDRGNWMGPVINRRPSRRTRMPWRRRSRRAGSSPAASG